METFQIIGNLIIVGLCTKLMGWGGFFGSIIGIMLYMYFN